MVANKMSSISSGKQEGGPYMWLLWVD